MHIVVIDDNVVQQTALVSVLRDPCWQISTLTTCDIGGVLGAAPALIFLGGDAHAFDPIVACQTLRAHTAVPLLFYGQRGVNPHERVRGLRAGADDYLPAPYHWREVAARITTILKRCGGDFRLDSMQQSVQIADHMPVRLSPTEYRLLEYLLRIRGQPVPSHRILADLWNEDSTVDRGSRARLAVYMYRLRAKLERDPHQPQKLLSLRDGRYVLAPLTTRDEAEYGIRAGLEAVERG